MSTSHDQYPQQFAQHVAEAEQSSPIKGLVGIEQEFALHPPEKRDEHTDWYRDYLVVQGDPNSAEVQSNRDRLSTAGRQTARDLVGSLRPTNDEEREKQKAWLEDIEDWHIGDLMNFELYSGLSEASLESGDNKSSNYYELLAASAKSPLEFRFGTGILQSGYYDNPGMSEVRIAPTNPVEALARRAVLITKLSELAVRYGVDLGMYNNPHINLSLYEQGEGGDMKPVLCLDSPDGQERMRMAVSGVGALFLEGLGHSPKAESLHEKHGSDLGTIGQALTAKMKKQASLRVMPSRLELRSGGYGSYAQGTTSQRMLMLLAGTQLGLDPTMQTQLEGYPAAQIVESPLFVQAEGYDKVKDLHLLRALEHVSYTEDESGKLTPIPEEYDFFWWTNDEKYLNEMFGFDSSSIEKTDIIAEGLFSTLSVNADGSITCDPKLYKEWYDNLGEEAKQTFSTLGVNAGSYTAVTERHKAIKMTGKVKTIEHHVELQDRTWTDFVERVGKSELIAKVMGKDGRKGFTDWLSSRGHPDFVLTP